MGFLFCAHFFFSLHCDCTSIVNIIFVFVLSYLHFSVFPYCFPTLFFRHNVCFPNVAFTFFSLFFSNLFAIFFCSLHCDSNNTADLGEMHCKTLVLSQQSLNCDLCCMFLHMSLSHVTVTFTVTATPPSS